MKLKYVIVLVIFMVIVVACQQKEIVVVSDPSAELENYLFGDEDIDNAVLQLADDVTFVPIQVGDVIPDGEIVTTTDNGEEDSLNTLLNVDNPSGYVCNIINNTNGNRHRI